MTFEEQISSPGVETYGQILQSLSQLRPLRALVVGDLFLDSYVEGSIHRISAEAPVPIVNAEKSFAKPGGAGNVALNLSAMGNQVVLLGRIGDDLAGEQLVSLLKHIDTGHLLKERGEMTGQKQRILSQQQQLIRIDWEKIAPLRGKSATALLQSAAELLPSADILAISDYGKGVCTPALTRAIIEMAKRSNCPVVVDPKGSDYQSYAGADFVKPNLAELMSAANLKRECTLDRAARALLGRYPTISHLLVTRSEEGMSLFDSRGSRTDFPAHFVKINDVTGAGDTAFAMLAHSWGCGLPPDRCAQLANCAAGIAVQQLGCAQIDLAQIAKTVERSLVSRRSISGPLPSALKSLLHQERALLIIFDSATIDAEHLLALIDFIEKRDPMRRAKVVFYCPKHFFSPQTLRLAQSLVEIDFFISEQKELPNLLSQITWGEIYRWKSGKFGAMEN